MVIRPSFRLKRVPVANKAANNPSFRRPNREKGYYLVEALVSCLLIGIISAGLADGYAKIQAFNTHSQTEMQAIGIAQEAVDQLRSQQFANLMAAAGTHQVPIVSTQGSTGDAVFPRPLLRDTAFTYYSPASANYIPSPYQTSDLNNYLQVPGGTVTVVLTPANNNTVLNITVTVPWSDGNGSHQYVVSTSLTAYGLNG